MFSPLFLLLSDHYINREEVRDSQNPATLMPAMPVPVPNDKQNPAASMSMPVRSVTQV